MAFNTPAQTEAVLLHLLTEHLTAPENSLFEELFEVCRGDGPDETVPNIAFVATAAIKHLGWLLTVAGGQTVAGALNIIQTGQLWAEVDQVERDMDANGDD